MYPGVNRQGFVETWLPCMDYYIYIGHFLHCFHSCCRILFLSLFVLCCSMSITNGKHLQVPRCLSNYSGCVQGVMNLNVQDSLYIHLFETYLNIYLPFGGVIPVSPRFIRLKQDQMKLGYKHTGTVHQSIIHFVPFLACIRYCQVISALHQ